MLAGDTSSADALETSLKSSSQSFRWKRLEITNAFHSALTEPLVQPLQAKVEQLSFRSPNIPIETCSQDDTWQNFTPALIARHTREPVCFAQAVERITDQLGPCVWLEAGSGSGISTLRRALGKNGCSHHLKSLSLEAGASLKPLAEVTAELWKLGLKIHFWPFHKSQQHQYEMLNLPPYQFDKYRHWLEWKELGPQTSTARIPPPQQEALLAIVRKSENGAEFLVNKRSNRWSKLCSGYGVLGVSALSLSSLLKLILEAISMIDPEKAWKTGACDIQQLRTQTPTPADAEKGVHLKISKSESPALWVFTAMSSPNLDRTYASGNLCPPWTPSTGTRGDFAHFQSLLYTTHIRSLMNDSEADSFKGRAVYNSLGALFQMPKSSQRVKQVSAKGSEATGIIQSSFENPSEALETIVQVPLLHLNGL